MTDQAPFIKHQASHPIRVIGTFKNEYGERFVIYVNENGDKPFITGDEYDWEPKVPLLWNNAAFSFSAAERTKIAEILWPTMEETISRAQRLEGRLKPGDTPESVMERYGLEQRQERQAVYGIVYDGDPSATPNNP